MREPIGEGVGTLVEMTIPSVMEGLPGKAQAFLAQPSGCSIIVAYEPAKGAPGGIWLPPDELMLWHMSIAHIDRYPTWDEIADARYRLCPEEITMAMLLPPPGEYVNEHPHCFHLWQVDDKRVPG